MAADYIHLLEEKLGVRFEVDKQRSWPEAIEAVKQHDLDMFSCVAKNAQREEYVNFTRPYLSFPMVIITSDEVSYIDGIAGLKGLSVGVVEGYATHEYLSTEHPEITLHLVTTSQQGLTSVSQGKIDVFVDNIATATHIIQLSGLTNLKISGEMPLRYELGMAVRKDWPELVNIVQRGLDAISQQQRKDIHNRWIGVRYEHGLNYSLFWKSLAIFLVTVSVLYFYIRKLSKEVEQRKTAETQAVKARDEAHQANQAKSAFLAVMSHELRTPLTAIKGSLALLSSDKIKDPEKKQKMLSIANDNSNRLMSLINEVLDFEKLLAHKMTFNKVNVNVETLLHKAMSINQGYADIYQVSLKVTASTSNQLTIYSDESRLMQVLSNFLSNAIKYSPSDGVVTISTLCQAGRIRVSVSDHGEGIPAAFHPHIFSPFSQADTSDTREKGGTGLGLAISKEIIEHLQGDIGFTSVPGKGTTFYFELAIDG